MIGTNMKKFMMTCTLLLCLTSCIADSSSSENEWVPLSVGTVAPDFTISTDEYPDGYQLTDLKGRWVMIEFWAQWCPDCRSVTQKMKEMWETYGSDEVVFVGFSLDTDEEAWRNYIRENGLDWQQTCEFKAWKDSEVATAYNVQWIPTFYLIDKEGFVAYATIEIDDMSKKLKEIQ